MIALEIILFVFLLVIAIAVLRMTDLFAAAMLTGLFSLVAAGLMMMLECSGSWNHSPLSGSRIADADQSLSGLLPLLLPTRDRRFRHGPISFRPPA